MSQQLRFIHQHHKIRSKNSVNLYDLAIGKFMDKDRMFTCSQYAMHYIIQLCFDIFQHSLRPLNLPGPWKIMKGECCFDHCFHHLKERLLGGAQVELRLVAAASWRQPLSLPLMKELKSLLVCSTAWGWIQSVRVLRQHVYVKLFWYIYIYI